MEPIVKTFEDFPFENLYQLFKNVYLSSESMSELFEEKYPSFEAFKLDAQHVLDLPGSLALVAEIDGKAASYLTVRPRVQARLCHTADLNMGVASQFRGNGLGFLLLKNALEQLAGSSLIEIIYLMVRSDNLPAIKLYEKVGFEKLALLEKDTKIESAYFDGVLMRKFVKNVVA